MKALYAVRGRFDENGSFELPSKESLLETVSRIRGTARTNPDAGLYDRISSKYLLKQSACMITRTETAYVVNEIYRFLSLSDFASYATTCEFGSSFQAFPITLLISLLLDLLALGYRARNTGRNSCTNLLNADTYPSGRLGSLAFRGFRFLVLASDSSTMGWKLMLLAGPSPSMSWRCPIDL
jgi:hypothetical protein